MKLLVLIRGLSGSGKTTLADLLVHGSDDGASLSVDDYFVDSDGVYKFEREALKEAHEWCVEESEVLMKEGVKLLVLHNTFTRKWECERYFDLAREHGYEVQVVSLYDGGLNDRALSERGVHGVPEHDIQAQRRRWELDVYPHRNNPVRRSGVQREMVMVPMDWIQRGGGRRK